jgi:hypothetical protein
MSVTSLFIPVFLLAFLTAKIMRLPLYIAHYGRFKRNIGIAVRVLNHVRSDRSPGIIMVAGRRDNEISDQPVTKINKCEYN